MKAAVCVFVRDEERDIAEWLAFQFAVVFVLVHDAESEFGEHSDLRGVVMTGRRLMGL